MLRGWPTEPSFHVTRPEIQSPPIVTFSTHALKPCPLEPLKKQSRFSPHCSAAACAGVALIAPAIMTAAAASTRKRLDSFLVFMILSPSPDDGHAFGTPGRRVGQYPRNPASRMPLARLAGLYSCGLPGAGDHFDQELSSRLPGSGDPLERVRAPLVALGTARCAQNRARLVRALYERLDRLAEPLPAAI
ncbi:hypothetical protein GCM10010207_87740 [Streptomyces atratus]|nr:hypothetical protein GCM10010207_87740 [Streptomyces atratus]